MTAEASLDLGSLHLEAAFGRLADSIEDLKTRLRDMQDDLVISQTGVCPNPSATFAIEIGSPNAGKWWQVRNIIIGGDDITITPAGVAWVVVTATAPPANPSMPTVRDWTKNALPQNAFYGAHELVVKANETLWVVVTGGTAGTQYSATACVESFPQFVMSSL